jgi:hypothetical protein
MRATLCWTALILLGLAAAAPAAEEKSAYDGSVSVTLGGRSLEDGDLWDPASSLDSLAVDLDWGRETWPIRILVGLGISKDSKEGMIPDPDSGELEFSDVHSQVVEVTVGIVHYFRLKKRLQPFAGGGLTIAFAERELRGLPTAPTDEGDSVGFVVKTGVRVRVAANFHLGVEGRALLGTDVELFGVKGNADGMGAGVLFAWTW